MALIVIDVAAGQRRPVEVPGEELLAKGQFREVVGVALDAGRIADALEQVLAFRWSLVSQDRCHVGRGGHEHEGDRESGRIHRREIPSGVVTPGPDDRRPSGVWGTRTAPMARPGGSGLMAPPPRL